jgi:hypothetical protein
VQAHPIARAPIFSPICIDTEFICALDVIMRSFAFRLRTWSAQHAAKIRHVTSRHSTARQRDASSRTSSFARSFAVARSFCRHKKRRPHVTTRPPLHTPRASTHPLRCLLDLVLGLGFAAFNGCITKRAKSRRRQQPADTNKHTRKVCTRARSLHVHRICRSMLRPSSRKLRCQRLT